MTKKLHFATSVATSLLCATALTAGIFGLAAANRADAAEADPMSPENYFSTTVDISEAQPATVPFEGVTANSKYMLAVDPWYGSSEGTVYTAALNGGEALTLESNENMYGSYINYFTLPATSGTFTITTTETSSTTINVSLYANVDAEALPVKDADKVSMAEYETFTFMYEFDLESGYYAFTPNVTGLGKDQEAYFGIERKLDPNYFVGEPVSVGEPVWYDNGTVYYFSVQYLGGDLGSPITAYFTFTPWTAGTITIGREFYTIVTNEDTEDYVRHTFPTDMSEGEYLLNFSSLPEAAYGATITAFVGKGEEVTPYDVDIFGGTRITIAAGDSIYFTTDGQTFAAAAVISKAPSQSVDFTVGKKAEVKLQPNETLECTVVNVGETANYQITISDVTGAPEGIEYPVSVSNAYGTIVEAGKNSGMFPIVLAYPNEYGYEGETSTNATLNFTNTTGNDIAFFAEIVKADMSDYVVGADSTIHSEAGSSVAYFFEAVGGTYLVTCDNITTGVQILDYFNRYAPIVYDNVKKGLTTFGVATSSTKLLYAFVVTNESTSNIDLSLNFTRVNSLALGENTITANDNETYYIGDIVTGTYTMTLSDISEGATVTVKDQDDKVIVSNDQLTGEFKVVANEGQRYALIGFTITAAAGTTFKLNIQSTVDGTMKLDEPQKVTLGFDDEEESYNIALSADVEYTVTLEDVPEDITVFVFVNGTFVTLKDGVGTFTLNGEVPANSVISFSYIYTGTDYTRTFEFNVTVSLSKTAE